MILNGYKIPFLSTPPRLFYSNNISALNAESFVTEEITALLDTGRIIEVTDTPHVVNPLSVSKNNDSTFRLILDLSSVNPYIFKDFVKFEDWKVMEDYVQPGDYLWKFDIRKGYHHVDI